MAKKVYLAVPLIANRDLKRSRQIAQILTSLEYDVISRWVLEMDPGYNLSPMEVFERDMIGVRECDVLVAEVSRGSHGVGMEILLAHILGKEVVCIYRKGRKVSRMIMGLPNAAFMEYTSEGDMRRELRKVLASL